MAEWNVRIGRFSPRLAQWLSCGYGWCLRCKTPWNLVDDHETYYDISNGCFPLCEKCWTELTPRGRLPFYRELIESWYKDRSLLNGVTFEDTWAAVQDAVLKGL